MSGINREYSFDPLCLELACHFLPDDATIEDRNDLAQVIQDAVEDYIQGRESKRH